MKTKFTPVINKNYFQRYKSTFFPYTIAVTIIALTSFKISGLNLFLFFNIGFFFLWGTLTHFIVKKSIKSISIDKNKISLVENNFNKASNKTYDLKNISINIKSQGQGRLNVEYYLKIISPQEVFTINKLNDWKYNDLIEIYEFVNSLKVNSKQTNSHLLNFMKLKAKGYSSFDIAFRSKTNKHS